MLVDDSMIINRVRQQFTYHNLAEALTRRRLDQSLIKPFRRKH